MPAPGGPAHIPGPGGPVDMPALGRPVDMPAPGRLRLDELIRQLPPEGDIQAPWERGAPRLGIPQLGIPIPRAEVRAPQGGGRRGGGGGGPRVPALPSERSLWEEEEMEEIAIETDPSAPSARSPFGDNPDVLQATPEPP